MQFERVPLESIIDSSKIIFEGTVLSQSVFKGSDSIIYTANTVQIAKILKSDGSIGCGYVEIVTLGGDFGGHGSYVPGSISFNVGVTGIFMCIATGRPHMTLPTENPHALEIYADVQGFIEYETINSTTTIYHWYWYDLPNLTNIYTYFTSLTGYTYTPCSYKTGAHKTINSYEIEYTFTNEAITHSGAYLEYDVLVSCSDYTYLDDVTFGIIYDYTTFGCTASGRTTVTNEGDFALGSYNSPIVGDNNNTTAPCNSNELSIEITTKSSGTRIGVYQSSQKLCHVKMELTGACPSLLAGLETDFLPTSSYWYDDDSIGGGNQSTYSNGTTDKYNGSCCPGPQISGFTPTTIVGGSFASNSLLTINGSGFGSTRGSQQVFFTNINGRNIDAAADDFNYYSWSATQIKVYVPGICWQSVTANTVPLAGTGYIAVGTAGISSSQGTSSDPLTIEYSVYNRKELDYKTLATTPMPPEPYWFLYSRNSNGTGGMSLSLNSTDFPLSSWQIEHCIKEAVKDWVCETGVNMSISPTYTTARVDPSDGINTICYQALPAHVLGQTTITWNDCDDHSGYYRVFVTDVDIALSPPTVTYYYIDADHIGTCPENQVDYRSNIEHELGHAMGLNHTLNTGDMMYPDYADGTIENLSYEDIDGGTYEVVRGEEPFTNSPCTPFTQIIPLSCPTDVSALKSPGSQIYNISIYPNPFTNEIHISFDNIPNSTGDLMIMNMEGKVVYQNTCYTPDNNADIDLGFLPVGIYILRYFSTDKYYTCKFAKQ